MLNVASRASVRLAEDARECLDRLSGPAGKAVMEDWDAFDFDEDADVDLLDWTVLAGHFTGE